VSIGNACDQPRRWLSFVALASKFDNLVTTVYGIGTADEPNQRGLSAHMLSLPSTDFGARPSQARAGPLLAPGRGLWSSMRHMRIDLRSGSLFDLAIPMCRYNSKKW
jgi:hypothetical protein